MNSFEFYTFLLAVVLIVDFLAFMLCPRHIIAFANEEPLDTSFSVIVTIIAGIPLIIVSVIQWINFQIEIYQNKNKPQYIDDDSIELLSE